jgi:small subunit ribosomal protein S1
LLSALLQVGDKLKVLVVNVDAEEGRVTLSTKQLEQQRGDFVRLSRNEFADRAEVQAAAWRDKIRAASSSKQPVSFQPEVTTEAVTSEAVGHCNNCVVLAL